MKRDRIDQEAEQEGRRIAREIRATVAMIDAALAPQIYTLTQIADRLEAMAGTQLQKEDAMICQVAAKVLRRRAETVGDEVCLKCGCGMFDPCETGMFDTCGWANPGLCTACAKGEKGKP